MKYLKILLVVLAVFMLNGHMVSAQTLLPEAKDADCVKLLNYYEQNDDFEDTNKRGTGTLGCAVKTGRISLSMLPYFIRHIADFLLGLSTIICLLFVINGGYQYIWGSLTDQMEKGRKTIINALMGLGFAALGWAVIAMTLAALTA
jgi:hypothetical protein